MFFFLGLSDWTFTPLRCRDHEDPESTENKQGQSQNFIPWSVVRVHVHVLASKRKGLLIAAREKAHRSAVLHCNNSVCWDKGLQISLSQSEYFLASLVEGLQDPSNSLILLKVGRFAKYAVNPGISVDMLGQTLKSF